MSEFATNKHATNDLHASPSKRTKGENGSASSNGHEVKTALEQLSEMTSVVADTGDVNAIKQVIAK